MKYSPSVTLKTATRDSKEGGVRMWFCVVAINRRLGRCRPNGQSERLAQFMRSNYPRLCGDSYWLILSSLLHNSIFQRQNALYSSCLHETINIFGEVLCQGFFWSVHSRAFLLHLTPHLVDFHPRPVGKCSASHIPDKYRAPPGADKSTENNCCPICR